MFYQAGVRGLSATTFKGDATMSNTESESTKNEMPVWFITGCSTGFGRDLAMHLLERNPSHLAVMHGMTDSNGNFTRVQLA